MAHRLLLIDDDVRLYELLASYLEESGFSVTTAADGPRGLALLGASLFDAVLLDVMMPGIDGLEVCRRIRSPARQAPAGGTPTDVPILMLTARGDETDRVVGLELGADDYIPKPFSPRELVARLRAVLRRTQSRASGTVIRVGGLHVDVESRTANLGDRLLDLTAIEFDLLLALARRAGRVVAREALLAEAGRGNVVVSDRTVDVHISHLRQKLGDDSKVPKRIKTVRGVGYVLAKEP